MNALEKKMVSVLAELKENHAVIGVKAEFEAEGTRMEEALRLKEVVTLAGLGLTIKIGGCEALKDMYDARAIGVARIVAPMIESAYALGKFVLAAGAAFPADELSETELAVNVETPTAVAALDEMLSSPAAAKLDSVVIGRVDLSQSLGLTREDINSRKVFEVSKEVAVKCKKAGLKLGIGGGVSADSLAWFRDFAPGSLDFYETRKVIFNASQALGPSAREGILKSVGFELMWLKNKRNYYGAIHHEDEQRILLLENRYSKMILEAGGKYE